MSTTYLRPAQIAEQFGWHPSTVRKLITSGAVPSARVTPTGRYVVPAEALAEFARPISAAREEAV